MHLSLHLPVHNYLSWCCCGRSPRQLISIGINFSLFFRWKSWIAHFDIQYGKILKRNHQVFNNIIHNLPNSKIWSSELYNIHVLCYVNIYYIYINFRWKFDVLHTHLSYLGCLVWSFNCWHLPVKCTNTIIIRNALNTTIVIL